MTLANTLAARGDTQPWTPCDPGTLGSVPVVDLAANAPTVDDAGRVRLRPGSIIPGTRLCVEGWLGEGATAVVYRGFHVDLGRPLAIKVLRQPNPTPAMRERFLAEARLTTEVDSEHVVDVLDFGRLDDGRLYYAMAFLDGRPLDELMHEGPLPVPRAGRREGESSSTRGGDEERAERGDDAAAVEVDDRGSAAGPLGVRGHQPRVGSARRHHRLGARVAVRCGREQRGR